VPALNSFDYATLRVVPSAERAEFINAGVVLHCPEAAFLACRISLNEDRLRALWPALELDVVRGHLEAFTKVAAGDPDAGPIARLSRRERFHWLVSPRSTMIQISPVHSGLCQSPAVMLEDLFCRLVIPANRDREGAT
jgi:hypothetical protein